MVDPLSYGFTSGTTTAARCLSINSTKGCIENTCFIGWHGFFWWWDAKIGAIGSMRNPDAVAVVLGLWLRISSIDIIHNVDLSFWVVGVLWQPTKNRMMGAFHGHGGSFWFLRPHLDGRVAIPGSSKSPANQCRMVWRDCWRFRENNQATCTQGSIRWWRCWAIARLRMWAISRSKARVDKLNGGITKWLFQAAQRRPHRGQVYHSMQDCLERLVKIFGK